jgi:sulfur-carrier protein
MQITLRLYATLRVYKPELAAGAPDTGFVLLLAPGTTLLTVVEEHLHIPRQTVKLMFVNGIARDDSYVLQDGDEAGIFPPIAGGAMIPRFPRCW